ncbi:hypothetical protein MKW98_026542, partial [Papaver atlanticum]
MQGTNQEPPKPFPEGEGGTGCGIVLDHERVAVLAVDRELVAYEIKEDLRKHPEFHKVASVSQRFGLIAIGKRKYVNKWTSYLHKKIKDIPEPSLEVCCYYLNEYRINELADKGNHDTIELLLSGWEAIGQMKMHYFHNGGSTPITRYSIDNGSSVALLVLALDNKEISTLTVEDATSAAKRAIYDAYLTGSAGRGVDVMVIRPGAQPQQTRYSMEQLQKEFKTTLTSYKERRL